MQYTQILKRSWKILWSYPALWVFGIILALTAGATTSSPSSRYNANSPSSQPSNPSTTPNGSSGQFTAAFNQFWNQLTQTLQKPDVERTIIVVVLSLVCLLLLIGILFTIGKYVSRVALVRMVDGYETTGEKVSWKQGFRLGWSRSAWRLFLIDLVVGLPVAVVFILLIGISMLPLILGLMAGGALTLVSIIPTIGLVFLVIFLGLAVGLLMALVMEIIWRVCILQQTGVFDAIRLGWQMVRKNLKHVFLMWLILVGIGFGYSLASIPVALILLVVGVLVGGAAAVALYLILQAAAGVTAGVIAAVVVGLLLLLLAVCLPLLFLGGLKQTYFSTTWTLVYREFQRVLPEAATLPVAPAPALEGDAAPVA